MHGYWYARFNRLTREDACEANRRYEYTYDWKGNITGKKEYELDTGTLLSTKSYTYRSSGWTGQLIGYNGESISYDAIGNFCDKGAENDGDYDFESRRVGS